MKIKRKCFTKAGTYKGVLIEPQIRDFFCGRIWIKEHVPFPKEKIDTYIQHGFFTTKSGITITHTWKGRRYQCHRCHNENPQQFIEFECARCKTICVYCRHCINMGRISSCTTLLLWNGPKPLQMKHHTFQWKGNFTEQQKAASQQIIESVKRNRNHLVHAVTGAGKTEMLFPSVRYALQRGKRVCIATPRTDVVLELFPRFQKVFPNTTIHALYGGAPKQQGFAQLILATTHQLYRFENSFHVVIVDEADAFPYTVDESLQRAVFKSKTPSAPIIFVTATPSSQILSMAKKERWGYSFIPTRYHGYPLPIPRFESLWFHKKFILKGRLPKKLKEWTTRHLHNNKPFLIFFPTISLMEQALPLFQRIHENIEAVHAEDPKRKEKVMKLRNQEVPGLLTTTILERGITISNLQVAVIGAESKIFNAAALIQISGRVGRNVQFPNGEIVFFHHGISVEMDSAKEEILRLNRVSVKK